MKKKNNTKSVTMFKDLNNKEKQNISGGGCYAPVPVVITFLNNLFGI